MRIWARAAAIAAAVTVAATFVSGCGVNTSASESGSFGDAAAGALTDEQTAGETGNVLADRAAGSLAESGDSRDEVTVVEKSAEEGRASNQATLAPGKNFNSGSGNAPASEASNGGSAPAAPRQSEQGEGSRPGTTGSLSGSLGTTSLPSPTPTTPTTTTIKPTTTATMKPSATAEPADRGTGASNDSGTKTPSITWAGFFDNEDQTTPSEQFWDLSDERATVRIKGFMGEVLSISANWFLLIPEPGAECPFDNGDETYWNKIMIVFVKDGTKLRYTSKPLELTGRLDVGIKVDESGYKTMFRLYDATFKEIKA